MELKTLIGLLCFVATVHVIDSTCVFNKYCAEGRTHVACEKPRPYCDSKRFLFADGFKIKIENFFNDLRNKAAGGYLRFPPADHMNYVKFGWAKPKKLTFAEATVRKCILRGDSCRNTRNQKFGQRTCIFNVKNVQRAKEVARDRTRDCFRLHANGTFENNLLLVPGITYCELGAGVSTNPKKHAEYPFILIVVINVNKQLATGAKPYTKGKPGHGCKQPHYEYKNLCSKR